MSVSLKTLQKEAENLRMAIDKQTRAGADATTLINTLSSIEAEIKAAEAKAETGEPAKAKSAAKKTAKPKKAEAEEPARPEMDRLLADLLAQKSHLASLLEISDADRAGKEKIVAELERKHADKRAQHSAIEHRRNMGDEQDSDAAQLYMLNLDLQALDAKIAEARETALEPARECGRLNSELAELTRRELQREHEIKFEAAVKRLAELDAEFMLIHADMIREANACRRSFLGAFRFSMQFRLMLQHYGYLQ